MRVRSIVLMLASPFTAAFFAAAFLAAERRALADQPGAAQEPAEAPSPPSLESQPANTWVKRSPLVGGPVSPRLGYEGACVWDNRRQVLLRFGGHNQGGGGEQGGEVWTYDPRAGEWKLHFPNTSPPGVCCNAQNLFDPVSGRYIRFPYFSGSHGWQWPRELYLNDSSVWTYDLAANQWRNMRPLPTPKLAPYRCASWDSEHALAVVFGGEGGRDGTVAYDPWSNTWRFLRPAGEPESRSGGNMAYDAARRLHVMFGSQFNDDQNTWIFDLNANAWRSARPPEQPPTKENDPALTYDPVHRVVLALVKVTTGKDEDARHEVQTWAYDAGANRWTRPRPAAEPDGAGNRTRNLMFAPELNLALLENCTSRPREQQVWTYRHGAAEQAYVPPPAPRRTTPPLVEDVVVSVASATRVELEWQAPADDLAGYHVERAVVEVWSDDQLQRLKKRTPPLEQPSVGAIRRVGAFVRLTNTPLAQKTYVDESVDLHAPQTVEGEPLYDAKLHAEHLDNAGRAYRFAVYAYRVLAVNRQGALGGPSPAFYTIPQSPQRFFSRDVKTTCELRWAANAEKHLAGYRVYRLDGRWDRDAVSRLTAEPVAATEFADAAAGAGTRRYHVLAVDKLGQEGFPSSPVWFNREWKEFYKPFETEWKQ